MAPQYTQKTNEGRTESFNRTLVLLEQLAIRCILTTQVQNSDNFSLNEPAAEENEDAEVEMADRVSCIIDLSTTFSIRLRILYFKILKGVVDNA